MKSFIFAVIAAGSIGYGAHYLLTERPDLVEAYLPWLEIPGSSADKFSSPNVRL